MSRAELIAEQDAAFQRALAADQLKDARRALGAELVCGGVALVGINRNNDVVLAATSPRAVTTFLTGSEPVLEDMPPTILQYVGTRVHEGDSLVCEPFKVLDVHPDLAARGVALLVRITVPVAQAAAVCATEQRRYLAKLRQRRYQHTTPEATVLCSDDGVWYACKLPLATVKQERAITVWSTGKQNVLETKTYLGSTAVSLPATRRTRRECFRVGGVKLRIKGTGSCTVCASVAA